MVLQNDAPVCSDVSIATVEDTTGSVDPACTDIDLDPLTYEINSQPAHGSAAIVSGKLNYTPAANYHGTDTFTYKATDGLNPSAAAAVSVSVSAVNDAPFADPQTLSALEDTALSVTLTGGDVDGDPVTLTITSQPTLGSLSGAIPNLIYTPAANNNGPDSFSFTVCENVGALLCTSATVDLTVTAINDAPSFTPGPDQTVLEDSGSMIVDPWATGLSARPADESGQTLAFQVMVNTNPGLFSAGPTISSFGVLAFTPAPNASGSASVTIRLQDNGGTSSGGVQNSLPQTLNINVATVNDAPVVMQHSIYDTMVERFAEYGGYLCSPDEKQRLRQVMWPDGEHLSREVVGQPALKIAELAGIPAPAGTTFLMVQGEAVGSADLFSGEKLSPVLTLWRYGEFEEAIGLVRDITRYSGYGHSCGIHTTNQAHVLELATRARVSRMLVRQTQVYGNSGNYDNGMPFALTLGCGTWGGNITSENVHWKHFINTTWVSMPIPPVVPDENVIFDAHWQKFGL
ncbi:MAG: Ig-like domain-containing protein [Bellilinea sp.]